MSFQVNWGSSTRQDHLTFMNGAQPRSKDQRTHTKRTADPSAPRTGAAHVSYAIGAPATTSPTRSPKRLTATASQPVAGPSSFPLARAQSEAIHFTSEEAAHHHARLRERNESRFTSVPRPAIKDTTVNIATAFHQAATGVHMAGPPSTSSTSDRLRQRHPSEDRRLGRPPEPGSRNREARSHASITEEDDASRGLSSFQRAKSPMEAVGAIAAATVRAVSPMVSAVFLKPPSSRAGQRLLPNDTSATLHNGADSYDYSREEDILRGLDAAASQATVVTNGNASQRRKSGSQRKLNPDNMAYRPSPEGSESEEISDGGTRRRKKGSYSMRVNSLPTVGPPAKRRVKKAKRTSQSQDQDDGGSAQEESSLDQAASAGLQRLSRQSSVRPGDLRNTGELRLEDLSDVVPDSQDGHDSDIQEIERPARPEPQVVATSEEESYDDDGQEAAAAPSPLQKLQLGARIGSVVHFAWQTLGMLLLLGFRTFAAAFQLVVARPWFFALDTWHEWRRVFRGVKLSHVVGAAIFILVSVLANYTLSGSQAPADSAAQRKSWGFNIPFIHRQHDRYRAPELPPGSVQELVDRLTHLETAFSELESNHQRTRQEHAEAVQRAENEARVRETVTARLNLVETRLEGETRRAIAAEELYRASAQKTADTVQNAVQGVKNEVKSLQGSVAHLPSAYPTVDPKSEERIRHLESHMKDIAAMVKSSSTKGGKVTMVTPGGNDMSTLISNLLYKDTIGRRDYAMYYSGGKAIPHLTSKSHSIGNRRSRLLGTRAVPGPPPVLALTPDIAVGNCWSFTGAQGQIGILLSRVIYLTHITIDNAPKDLVLDLSTAPRQFSVWVLVEEKENRAKADKWEKELEARRLQAGSDEESARDAVPKPFGTRRMLHFGSFEYNVRAEQHAQTFEIPEELQALGIDVTALVIQFHSNWGNPNSTCIYRIRAHGSELNPPEIQPM